MEDAFRTKVQQFRRVGTMLDCSRNAVANLDSLREWIDLTAGLGFTTLMLYTEDTYELAENPYFGYLRGRYSKEDLKEVDAYAASKHMELIPCIQTLAHLRTLKRWPEYAPHFDAEDILLIDDDRVYALIDRIFSTLSQCFTSRIAHIGMDEANMLGRGRYLEQHGYHDAVELLLRHLKRVAAIGAKYGFSLLMWSDLFFNHADSDSYASTAKVCSIKAQIPDNVSLVYWDYYATEKAHYDQRLQAHKALKADTWFAGGLWSWTGYAPHNGFSIRAARAAIESCQENAVQDIFFALWGDDGGECSRYALLPSLFYVSEHARGNSDAETIKCRFQKKFRLPFEKFMLLDLPGTPNGTDTQICNAEKFLLYQDCFLGLMDRNVAPGTGALYASCAARLAPYTRNRTWGYLFLTQKALCEVLQLKAELGVRTQRAYAARDCSALEQLLRDYQETEKRLKHFYETFKRQWLLENKPHGFDVQDIRLGGLIWRVKSCKERLQALYDGKIDRIEELEEPRLELLGHGEVAGETSVCYNSWKLTVTVNPI